ncbi:MAG: hypothetical protein P8Y95_11655 [Gammaproteobacteria bacterium]|jgi:hypothetical protein
MKIAMIAMIALIVSVMACLASVARAAESTQASTPADPGAAVSFGGRNPNTIVCRRISTPGSHFKREVCMTERQWKLEAEATQMELEQEIDRFEARQTPSGF